MQRPNDQTNTTNQPASRDDTAKSNPEGHNEADAIDTDDPHKVEKLAKLGHAGDEAAEGTE